MKFMTKSLVNALYKQRTVYRPAVFLRQCSKKEPSQNKRGPDENKESKWGSPELLSLGLAVLPGFAFIGFQMYQLYSDVKKGIILEKVNRVNKVNKQLEEVSNVTESQVGQIKQGLPTFGLSEIRKHNSIKSGVWVTFKDGVYDITDYIKYHPGGSKILKGAGTSLEPLFKIFPVHNSDTVYTILEDFRIGNLRKSDVDECADENDPFYKDPIRHGAMYPHVKKPFNGGTEPALLVESFYTPNELFYVRNHLPVPQIDPATYTVELHVEGESKKYTFTLDDIKKMPQHTVIGTLMCIGNRRTEMLKVKPMTAVVKWNNSAMGCAVWKGVRLRDFLQLAGVDGENEKHKHVHFEGYDEDNTGTHFASSMPIWRAVDKRTDVLLAYEMNGEPLPRDHGFPLRLFIPGCAGVRQVKWLGHYYCYSGPSGHGYLHQLFPSQCLVKGVYIQRGYAVNIVVPTQLSRVVPAIYKGYQLAKIWVSDKESQAHWYQNEYKGFSPSTDWDNVDFSSSPASMETPVTSSICNPVDGDTVQVVNGHVTFKGYAWSGNGCRVIRIDITADGGKTWLVADLDQLDTPPPQHWTWTLWSVDIPVASNVDEIEVWAKAVDSSYNSQPESFENIYNFRGVMNNAYPRVKVKLKH